MEGELMNQDLINALRNFLTAEKQASEQQILNLKDVRFGQRSQASYWQSRFNECRLKSIWHLPTLIYIFFRLESAKSAYSHTEHCISYFTDAHALISKGLNSLPDNDYSPALTALDHIAQFRPISSVAFHPDYLHEGEFSRPRYTARYFFEQLHDCQNAIANHKAAISG